MKRLVLAVAVLAVAAACTSDTPETADTTAAMVPAPTVIDTAITDTTAAESTVVVDSIAR